MMMMMVMMMVMMTMREKEHCQGYSRSHSCEVEDNAILPGACKWRGVILSQHQRKPTRQRCAVSEALHPSLWLLWQHGNLLVMSGHPAGFAGGDRNKITSNFTINVGFDRLQHFSVFIFISVFLLSHTPKNKSWPIKLYFFPHNSPLPLQKTTPHNKSWPIKFPSYPTTPLFHYKVQHLTINPDQYNSLLPPQLPSSPTKKQYLTINHGQ